MNDFLPQDYEAPAGGGQYMKFTKGVNKFRFISSPITGWVWFIEDAEGKPKPLRIKMNEEKPAAKLKAKHFWAAIVYDYASSNFKILEITQKSIQSQILDLNSSESWGSPKSYDLIVTRKGDGMETEYSVMPEPKREFHDKEGAASAILKINLNALYEGADPFNS